MRVPKEKSVLIVDDDKYFRKTLTSILTAKGFKVEVAENGLNALEVLKSITPDVIVLDLHMPIMSGVELMNTLIEIGSNIPILVLSGFLEETIISKLQHFDGSDFLCKSFNEQELVQKVESILGKTKPMMPSK